MLAAFLAALTVASGAFGITLVTRLWGAETDPSAIPWSRTVPVLGGQQPQVHAWNRFHARYYPMTLVLIAFEMEMMFMYPWAVVFVEEGLTALIEMGVFLLILSLGILYSWREGVFRWQ